MTQIYATALDNSLIGLEREALVALGILGLMAVMLLTVFVIALRAWLRQLRRDRKQHEPDGDPCDAAKRERDEARAGCRTAPENQANTATPNNTTRDPEQGINGLNWWGALYAPTAMIPAPPAIDAPLTVPMTPREAEQFAQALEAERMAERQAEAAREPVLPAPLPPVRTHCPYCVIQTCDEWGIPVDPARVIGPPVYCRKHRWTILARAHARLGA